MAGLDELKRGATVKGILPDGFITVVDVSWIGSVAIELTYKDSKGKPANELIYRDRESDLEILESGKPWSFDGDSDLFRLVSEAHRIRLAYLFDPLLAVHTSLVDPLPPIVIGGALIVPAGLLMRLNGGQTATLQAKETKRVEMVAMRAAVAAEQKLDNAFPGKLSAGA